MNISLKGVTKAFGTHRVLDGIDADLEFPHVLALIGPSGGGKSTFLRLLAGLDIPDAGTITINGRKLARTESELREYRRDIGIVFQAYNLFPHLTALENVMLPLTAVHGVPVAEAAQRSMSVLERFKLEDHASKQPGQLSGGQRQRVAIARALAVDPPFLLLDEPTSALDPEMTAEVLEVISELRDSGRPLVLVTHEMGFARHTADLIGFVADGGIPAIASAEVFFTDPPEAVAPFLSKVLKY